MSSVTIRIDGLKELDKRLQQLRDDVQTKVARAACGAGARVIAKEARNRAPRAEQAHWRARGKKVPPGVLAKGIVAGRSRRDSVVGHEAWNVFVRHGKKLGLNDAFYAGWVEFGHYIVPRVGKNEKGKNKIPLTARRRMRNLRGAKFVPAHPFMRPAFDATARLAIDAMVARLKARLDKAGV